MTMKMTKFDDDDDWEDAAKSVCVALELAARALVPLGSQHHCHSEQGK